MIPLKKHGGVSPSSRVYLAPEPPGLSPALLPRNSSVVIIGQTNVDTNAWDSARTNDLEKAGSQTSNKRDVYSICLSPQLEEATMTSIT